MERGTSPRLSNSLVTVGAFRAKAEIFITSTWQAAANRPTTGAPRTMHAPEMLVFHLSQIVPNHKLTVRGVLMDDYARIEVQQVLNVLNAWLATVNLRVRSGNDGEGVVYDGTRELGKRDEPFPTIPHAVEWALTEARKRDRAAAHDAGLKGWLTDAIEDEDGDDNGQE